MKTFFRKRSGQDTARKNSSKPVVLSNKQPYIYQPLDAVTDFRLIKLLPGDFLSTPIICWLECFEIKSAQCPTYTAVSYVWGEPGEQTWIQVQDEVNTVGSAEPQALRVSKALYDILRHLRQENHPRWIWVDAICIDQGSTLEKNHQVALMGDIYSQANVVLAWLGLGVENTAFSMMRDAVEFAQAERFDEARVDGLRFNRFRYYLQRPNSSTGETKDRTTTEQSYRQLKNLCDNPYWSRKWILQEVLRARSVVLQIANETMPMAVVEDFFKHYEGVLSFSDAFDITQRHDMKFRSPTDVIAEEYDPEATNAARVLNHRWQARQKANPSTMHELIHLYDINKCSEPCDHVYALYNLVGPHRRHLKVDYAQDSLTRYGAVMQFISRIEQAPQPERLGTSQLLINQLQIVAEPEELKSFAASSMGQNTIQVSAQYKGRIRLSDETFASQQFRAKCQDVLACMQGWTLNMAAASSSFLLNGRYGQNTRQGLVTPQDLIHCVVDGGASSISALADQAADGDLLLQFPSSKLMFVMRPEETRQIAIIGRAIECDNRLDDSGIIQSISRTNSLLGGIGDEVVIRMTLAQLLDLTICANDPQRANSAL